MLKLSLVIMCVLIPRYNSEGNLTECLDSVLMEDINDRAIFISDGCATGNTLKVIETCSAFSCP